MHEKKTIKYIKSRKREKEKEKEEHNKYVWMIYWKLFEWIAINLS